MQGGWSCNAPFGYWNNRLERTLDVDLVHGKHVQMIHEYYVTSLYSFGELARRPYEVGFRGPKSRRKEHLSPQLDYLRALNVVAPSRPRCRKDITITTVRMGMVQPSTLVTVWAVISCVRNLGVSRLLTSVSFAEYWKKQN